MSKEKMDASSQPRQFGGDFWEEKLRELGYPLHPEELHVGELRRLGIFPGDRLPQRAIRLYHDRFVEVVLLEFGELPSRHLCCQMARAWKAKRWMRPMLVFTDGEASYAVTVPGKGVEGECRVLELRERLYRTDAEILGLLRYPGSPEKLREAYDTSFLPYEKVREEFFEGYRSHFERATGILRKHLGERARRHAQRFLGRLMFFYFLERKGWLPKGFINGIKDCSEFNRICYEDLAEGRRGLPHLDGSLFEREEYLTPELEGRISEALNPVFKEAREFFNRYNFTVDESTPLEVPVAVDPLLLGTVYENLLAERERKKKGTFYTHPNEIGFMCRRAISAYLGLLDKVVEEKGGYCFVDGLEELVRQLEEEKSEKRVRELKERLLSLRILDPAVGSGGFLVVMMQTLVQLIHQIESTVGWRSDPEELKRRILPNLYGFDIESEAVELAQLRLWLSLVIDQKEPEPLPNLDLNLMVVEDSLECPTKQSLLEEWLEKSEVKDLIGQHRTLLAEYLREHREGEKRRLRERMKQIRQELKERIKLGELELDTLEAYLWEGADMVVMNPPYVRQEDIPAGKKRKYISSYGFDVGRSDIYAYFMVRAVQLLKEGGVAAIISSDKWLEMDYGKELQEKLKPHLLAVFGQRGRSFKQDVNTVITLLKKNADPKHPLEFIYLDSYTGNFVRNYRRFERAELKPGKWYYLRAPKVFEEEFLPKLTHKLSDFAEVKRGFTTGADEFFYVKDVTHQFEADKLADPSKFRGVPFRNEEELQKAGLAYVENEAGERFLIEMVNLVPILRSPKQIRSYLVPEPKTLCVRIVKDSLPFTKKYLEWGEQQGFHERPTCKSRPKWYHLPELEEAKIFPLKSWEDVIYIPVSRRPYVCDQRLYSLYPKPAKLEKTLACYLNSTLFYLTVELYCGRLGGGATDIKVQDYEEMPVPDLARMNISFDMEHLFRREPLRYTEEVKQEDRKELDRALLLALGFPEGEVGRLVEKLHRAFVEVVEDRLIKAKGPAEVPVWQG